VWRGIGVRSEPEPSRAEVARVNEKVLRDREIVIERVVLGAYADQALGLGAILGKALAGVIDRPVIGRNEPVEHP
jgi:hypothetical protein